MSFLTYKETAYKCSTNKGDAYPYGLGDKPVTWKVSSNKRQPTDEHYGNQPYGAAGSNAKASQIERAQNDWQRWLALQFTRRPQESHSN